MKRMFKRWMALLLAVLMVMGTLPTSAWAARMTDDAVAEQPVLDGETDPVADTQARGDKDDERPEKPEDPDPGPGDLHTLGFSDVQINETNVASGTGVFATGIKGSGTDDNCVIFIAPNFTVGKTGSGETPKFETNNTGYFSNILNKDAANVTDYLSSAYSNLPYLWIRTDNVDFTRLNLDWNGKLTDQSGSDMGIEATLGNTSTNILAHLSSGSLATWAEGKTLYVPTNASKNAGEKLDLSKGLPFTVFFHGTDGKAQKTIYIPVAADPLKIEILNMEKEPDNQVAMDVSVRSADDKGLQKDYCYIRVTNTSGADMEGVVVTLLRQAPVVGNEPADWSAVDVPGDEDGEDLTDGEELALRHLYSLEGSTTSPGNTITVDIPATMADGKPGYVDIEIIAPGELDDDDWAYEWVGELILSAYTFCGKDDAKDAYSSFTVTAKNPALENPPVKANGGIHWSTNLSVIPQVIFVDQDGIEIDVSKYGGTGLKVENGVMKSDGTTVTANGRSVAVGRSKAPLTWNGSCYTSSTTASVGDTVWVDGKNSGKKLDMGTTKVKMYTVTVTDDPPGSAGTDTDDQKAKGAFTEDGILDKMVDYYYYPTSSNVRVYAKDPDGTFEQWLPEPIITEYTADTDNPGLSAAQGYNGTLTIDGANVDAVAKYKSMVDLKLVTTYNGNRVPGTGDVDVVFDLKIAVQGTGGKTYTYGWDSTTSSYDVLTDGLTAQDAAIGGGGVEPWSVRVPGNATCKITLNGFDMETIDVANTTPDDEGVYATYELVGVIPQVTGTTKAGSTLTLPTDQKNGRTLTGGKVLITGQAPNTGANPITLYYPTTISFDADIEGGIASSDLFSSLKYGTGDSAAPIGASALEDDATAWGIDDPEVKFTTTGDQPLIANFGAATGSAEITVLLDEGAYAGQTVKLSSDSTSADAASGRTVYSNPTEGTVEGGTDGNGVYTFSAVDPNATGVSGGKFYIFVGGKYVGKSITVTAGATEPAKETVEYFTLTVTNADGKGYIGLSTSDITGQLTANGTTDGVFLKGTTVYIRADAKNPTNYTFNTWKTTKNGTDAGGTAPAAPGSGKTVINSLGKQTTVDASFNKSKYQTQLHVTLNGANGKIDGDITKVECSGTDDPPDFKGNGVWEATVGAKQTWTVTTRSGAYTVDTNGDVDNEGDAAQTMKLYSVDVEKGDNGNDDSNAPYITWSGNPTRVIVKKGNDNTATLTLVPNAKTGYDLDKWVNAAEGATALPTGASVSGNTLTLASDYEPTDGTGLVLKPTYTYWTYVKVVDSSNNPLTGYTPSANSIDGTAVSGQTAVYKISGLDPTATDGYPLVANGYTSTVTVKPTNAGNSDDPVILTMYTVSAAAGTGGSVTLAGGTAKKYLPEGATDTTGWTIVATAASGYRLKDSAGKQWKLTAGDTYGALADDEAASTTLTVTTGIKADVVATAYFTQQWTVNSYVSNTTANPKSSAKLDGGSGDGTGSSAMSTKTIDAGESVQVTFTGGAGESLDGWSLTGGGAWNTDNGTTWTTWEDNAKPTGSTFYFKPSQNSTIVATVKTKEYPVQVVVRKDGTALTNTSGITVKLGTASLSYDSTGGYWTAKLEPNNTTGYVLSTNVTNVTGNPANTAKTMKFTIADGEKLLDSNYATGDAANLKLEVDYWTVTVETNGNGNGRVAGDSRNATTNYSASTPVNSASFIVEDGKELTWSTLNIATNYELKTWQVKGTDNAYTDVATAALPATAAATVTYKAVFGKKTADITVEILLDDEADTYTGDTAPYTVALANSGITGVQSATDKNKYIFSGVPYNEGETAYTLSVSRTGYYGAYSLPNITVNASSDRSYPVKYYTATAETNGTTDTARGNAKLTAGSGDSAVTAATDYKAATDPTVEASIVVLSGTEVTWEAFGAADNYKFGYWDADKAENKTETKKWTVSAKGVVHTAFFEKEKYNTYLDLTVNGEKWGTKGTVDGVDNKNIQNIQLVTADKGTTDVPNVTVAYQGGLWEAKGVANTYTAPYWRVTTADGAVYYTAAKVVDRTTDATVAQATATETLIGVTIEGGAGNGTTSNTPTLQAKVVAGGPTTAGSAKDRVVIRKEQQVDVALNKKTGYDFKSPYLAGNTTNPTADLTAAQGTGAETSFTLASAYAAPDDHADLYIKPQYTFHTTVVTKHKGTTPTDMTLVQIKEGTNVTTLSKETAGTGDHTGRYTATGLDTTKTYTVFVNGFESAVEFDADKAAGKDVDVTVYKVTVQKKDKLDDSLSANIDGSAGVNLGAAVAAKADAVDSVYLPIGAKTTTGDDDVTKIHLQAAVGTSNPKFRLYNTDVTVDTNDADEILWLAERDEIPDGTEMTVAITKKTDTQTPNNLTVGGDNGMQADITVTAYFLRQYDVTANVKDNNGTGNLAQKSTVKMTVTGLGSVAPTGTNPSNQVKASKVDEKAYVQVDFTKGIGETLTGWLFSGGDLYTILEDDGTLSGKLTTTTAGASTATTLYFVPTADGATVTAKVLQATYPITVKVNLNNAPYVDTEHKLEVQLRYGTNWASTIDLVDAVTADGTTTYDGVFTTPADKQASPGTTYRIYANGVDLGALADTERPKDISFQAYEAEGKKADGTAADDPDATIKAALERELNYYTLTVAKSFSDGKTPTNVFANHGGSANTNATDEAKNKVKIVLAKVDTQPNQNAAATSSISISVDSPYYKFINWTVSKDGDGDGAADALSFTTNAAVGIYTLPAEATLKVNDKIKTDGGITLTANFKRQYKVTVSRGTGANTVKVWTGDNEPASQIAVLVDEGGSVSIKSTGSDLFKEWTIAEGGKGDFTNNEGKGGEGAVGYLAADTFTPEKDSTLVATYWQDAQIRAGWTYDKGTGDNTKDSSTGVKARTVPWSQNDAQEAQPKKITVYGPKNDDGTYPASGTVLSEATEASPKGYTWDGDTQTYTLSEAYLKDLTAGKTYKVVVEYTLGKPKDHKNEEARTTDAEFVIVQSAHALTKVDIQVEDGTPTTNGSATASIDVDARDNVKHKLHEHEDIEDKDLTWTWFYSKNDPGQKELKGDALTAYENSVTAGTAPTGWTLLSDTMSGDKGATYNNFDIEDNTALKGMYIFAVVKATDSGTGTVITNAIPVDFDAQITLKKNTDTVTTDNGKYSVYLWPANAEGDFALDTAIPTAYMDATQTYDTQDSALTFGKSYHVYALETEGMDQDTVGNYVKVDDITITRTDNTATVQYYSVSVTNMSSSSSIKHLEDLKSGVVTSGQSAGETFSSYPSFTATTAKGATITGTDNNKGVLKGTKVGVKVNKLTGKNVGWEQDYKLTWQDKEGTETSFSDASPKLVQTSAAAVDDGYAYTDSLAKAVDFTGRLEQNYYTITGDVKDVGRLAGTIQNGGGSIKSATLTAGTGESAVTYIGSMNNVTPKGGHNTVVTFTVPKAAKDVYVLTAEPNDGTTMKGYTVPASTTAPGTVKDSAELDAVSADGADKFTIFVAATSLWMKVDDLDGKDGHSADAQNTQSKTAKHEETFIYDNYSAWTKDIQVSNVGNTKLTVTLDLQRSTLQPNGSWSGYDSIYKSGTGNNKLGGDDQDTDSLNGVQFVGLADTFTLDLTDDEDAGLAKTRTFTVKVPTGLENKDDVKYRFIFTTTDGRPDFATNAGPTLTFDLDLIINPVTLGRVTAELKDGTFYVKNHWLQEDAKRNGDTAGNAFYGDVNNSAEELEKAADKSTSMANLVKQGDTLPGGGIAGAGATESDIHYRWYVVDASVKDTDVSLNTTTGQLTVTAAGKTCEEVTDTTNVGNNGTSYTPRDEDLGKKLYLVAVGQRNATNAVRTPDEVNFNEDPVPIPYRAIITLYENKVGTGGNEHNQVKNGDKDSYSVWLWDTANGDFPADPTADGSKAIPATPKEGDDGTCTYTTEAVLDTSKTYQVWVSAYKDCAETYMRNTGKTVTGVATKDQEVNYYLVDVADTTLSQNDYQDREGLKDAQIPDDSTIFYNEKDLKTVGEAPTAKIPAKGETAATVDVKGNYVLNDTTVTFGYGPRNLDYDLVWDGGMDKTTDKPTVASPSHPLTYKDAPKAAVTTQLVLNLYDVDAYVVGPGAVSRVTMTMEDAGKTYTFVTDTTDYDGNGATVLLGMKNNTAVAEIQTGEHATFRLPKYTGTAGKAGYMTDNERDEAFKLTGYYAEHDDSSTLVEPEETFYKSVTGAAAYDIVLQGESFDMRVADNVPTNAKKNIQNDEGKFSTRKSGDGLYDQEKKETKDGTASQTIILNYNYAAEQEIELTVTNETNQPEDEDKIRYIYDVTFAQTKNFTEKGGITVKSGAGVTDDFAAGAVVESMGRNTEEKKRTLVIPAGLPVGKYEYEAEVSYLTEKGEDGASVAGTGAKVTYKLTVIVQPLTFTALTTPVKADDGTLGFGTDGKYTVTRAKTNEDEDDADLTAQDKPNDTAADPDTVTALNQDTDYGYQWINAPVGTTYDQVKDALSWANGVLTVGSANGVKKADGTGNATKTYKPNDNDSGRQIFLVIYGKDNAANDNARRNATQFALSPAYTNTYPGMVALKVNGAENRGEDHATSKDNVKGKGYAVTFVSKDDATVTATAEWKKVGDEWAYVANLQPNTNGYYVTISRAKDNATQVILEDAAITGEGVVTTIDPSGSNVVEAPFFTVTAKEFTAEEFKTGTGETFGEGASASKTQSGVIPTLLFAEDSAVIDSGAPVLSGQKIAAKAPDLEGDNAGKAWTQDYTLTWQEDDSATATGTFTGDHDTATIQDAEDAVATGYARAAKVTAKTFIGGRLDQNTYKVVGTVKSPTSNQQQVDNVTMKETTSGVLYWSDTDTETSGTRHQSAEWTDADDKHNSGDTVTFTVVKGTYTITGYEATGYTIRKVTVKGGTDGGAKRNVNVLEEVDQLTAATRIFDIYLELAGAKLTVTDTEKDPRHLHDATSTTNDDHKFANNNDDVHYYYKQLGNDDVFTLELHNPGNIDLTLKGYAVYELPTGTKYSDGIVAALNGKTPLTDLAVKKDGRSVITFTEMPDVGAAIDIGAGETDSGVDAVEAGKVTVDKDVYNKDDAVYVVKYASEYTDSKGVKHDGPTVYYVLDLKVEPLPIKKVTAETKDGTFTLQRAGDELDSVEVNHDLDDDTPLKGAEAANLEEADVSYIWYSAPTSWTAEQVRDVLGWNDGETTIVSSNSEVKVGTQTGYNTKSYTPGDAEQGRNFYLVAYRSSSTANASEYAVSDGVYAKVKVMMEARRTGNKNASGTTSPLLTAVNISTGEGEGKQTSNDGAVTVTSVADGANVIPFKATMTDVTAQGKADVPADANWYFVKWAVWPLTGVNDELDKDSANTPVATPVDDDALAMKYTATGQSTVIGYFDELPVLRTNGGSTTGGYNTSVGEGTAGDRTLTYAPNDGSGTGKVTIIVTPANTKTAFKDPDVTEIELGFEALDEVLGDDNNATMMDKVGGAGDYVLADKWIRENLVVGGTYTFTFYDKDKGTTKGGYAGYDRSVNLMISGGEVWVTAQVEDWNDADDLVGSHKKWGLVQTTSEAAEPDNDGGKKVQSTAKTKGNTVTIQAFPALGYAFDHWEVVDEENNPGTLGKATDPTTTVTTMAEECVVQAYFHSADFKVADGKAVIIYGDDHFTDEDEDGTPDKTDIVRSGEEVTDAGHMTFTYEVATADDLDEIKEYYGDAYADDFTAKPDWLTMDANGAFTVNTKATGNHVEVSDKNATAYSQDIRVEDEVVVYVKVTEDHSGKYRYARFVVDVEPGKLTVEHATGLNDVVDSDGNVTDSKSVERGDAYKQANLAAGVTVDGVTTYPVPVDEKGVPMYNATVLKYLFTYVKVKDQAGSDIDITGKAGDETNETKPDSGVYENGTWTVSPLTFQGTGAASPYNFTFTYKPGTAEKWDYAAAKTDMTLVIAKPPVGAEFADEVKNFDQVKTVLLPAGDGYYSPVELPEDYNAATATQVPQALAYQADAYRGKVEEDDVAHGEVLTYLDKEPVYTVKLRSVDAAIHGTTFTEIELTGFALAEGSSYPVFTNGLFARADGEKTFELKLAPVEGKVWVGIHRAKFTLTGYPNADELAKDPDREHPTVTATYELVVEMLPKVITSLDVTTNGPTHDEAETVKGTLEGSEAQVDLTQLDAKENKPLKEITVTPTEGPDDKVTKVEVDVEIDPNYIYTKDDPKTENVTEPEIEDETKLNGKKNNDPNITVDRDEEDGDHIVHITQNIPYLMFHDVKNDGEGNPSGTPGAPKVDYVNGSVRQVAGENVLGTYTVNLGAYGADVKSVTIKDITSGDPAQQLLLSGAKIYKVGGSADAPVEFPDGTVGDLTVDTLMDPAYILDLSGVDTGTAHSFTITLEAEGTSAAGETIKATYTMHVTITTPPAPPSGPSAPLCPCKVFYHIGSFGTTTDSTIEDVSESNRPSKVPGVTPLDGYILRGWSLTNPATLRQGEKITLVDPKTVEAKGETMTFYAVIVERPFHEHYVIGYPNGNFGPADNIDRASVATIIARAILPDFKEGANYGNPGGYGDVAGHWAESAIAYCSKFGVFKGYDDGNFYPNKAITRQEFALVIARLDGVIAAKDIPFDDIDQAGDWALDGIYTAYEKGLFNGYLDGTFKPLNNIRRDEAVKVFNAYLHRGVDADGLRKLHEYVHTGVASNVTGNGTDEYMTWPDVPRGHWAYYEIVEAANDHEYQVDFELEQGYTVPEKWDKCWIDERWRYYDDLSDGGPNAALVSAGFRVWLH